MIVCKVDYPNGKEVVLVSGPGAYNSRGYQRYQLGEWEPFDLRILDYTPLPWDVERREF